MHRIVIELFDRTTDVEADEIVREIRDGLSLSGRIWTTRAASYDDLTQEQIDARSKVWSAVRTEDGVTLTADEAAALWKSVLRDSCSARAIAKP